MTDLLVGVEMWKVTPSKSETTWSREAWSGLLNAYVSDTKEVIAVGEVGVLGKSLFED